MTGTAVEVSAAKGRTDPDVVLLDVDMPVLDGIGAITGILEAAPRARIVMHSAFSDQRDRAMSSGAHGWANKGQSWDEIRVLITEVLAEA